MVNVPDIPIHRDIQDTPDHELAVEIPEETLHKQRVVDVLVKEAARPFSLKLLNISMIGAAPFHRLSKRQGHQVFAVSLKEIEEALRDKQVIDPAKKLPLEYHDYLDVFLKAAVDKLPPHRDYDHSIQLKPDAVPPFSPLRGMSREELVVLLKYLKDNLSTGFIRASSSAAAAPVLFVKKPEGGLRFCVDYRALNKLTVKNRYPLPLIKETLDRLSGAKWFTKIDIIAAFNKLRIKEGEEWKTAFKTRYNLFEYLIMSFRLCNGPASFQHFINDVMRDYLNIFCTAYLDDILVYSKTLKEHKRHVRQVLQKLRETGIQADISKCEFHVAEVLYLGLIVGKGVIKMDPVKVSAIRM